MMPDCEWSRLPAAEPDAEAGRAARMRQQVLTKPPGALGALESAAVSLAALQGRDCPRLDRVHISVFAADHGVAEENVSAFPQAVTAQMIRNFATGGAAISVLARELGATLEVIDLGTAGEIGSLDGVIHCRLGDGTGNLCREPAMTEQQLSQALCIGREAAARARLGGADVFIGGEMGIANTTAAAAVACALLPAPPDLLAGPGTGLDVHGVDHKTEVLRQALARHRAHLTAPLEVLRRLSGFEIGALCGAYIGAAQAGVPSLVDGFIAGTAALAAVRINPSVRPWLLFGHGSAEPGHSHILAALDAEPLLRLGMRLGEGSGAAVAVATLRLACALHGGMATFEQAEVSNAYE